MCPDRRWMRSRFPGSLRLVCATVAMVLAGACGDTRAPLEPLDGPRLSEHGTQGDCPECRQPTSEERQDIQLLGYT